MKIETFLFLLLLFLLLSACGQSPAGLLEQGNEAYDDQSYDEALDHYNAAEQAKPGWPKPIYNTANTHYRQGAFDQAQQLLQQVVGLASEELAQHGFFNLGNSFFQIKQWDTAVEAYKNALRLNPDDADAKYNLELALQQQQQEQQEQQDQQEPDQNQKDQQEQNQPDQQERNQPEQNQDQQDQPGQNQPEQNQEAQNNQDQGQPDQNQSPDSSEVGQNEQSQPQPAEGLTEEQARQLFGSVGEQTETLQEKLQKIYVVPGPPPEKDW